jgi:hypothetical protein
LGALLLIASNWAGLPKAIKLLLALLLPILPICFAYWQLNIKNESKVLGQASNILGLALVGGSLSLIGQIYNLESNIVTFLWTWAFLTTPFVFVFKKKENVLFSATIIGAALIFSIFDFLEKSNMQAGTAILLVTIVGLVYAYFLYAIGANLRYVSSWTDSSRILRIGGAGLASTILFVMTFGWYAQLITDNARGGSAHWGTLSFCFNILFVSFLIFTLIRAIKFEEYSFAFSIVRLFGLYLLVKYFTLFYSMFDTGIFFIIGGILFITGGWALEKKKNILIAYMRGSVRNTGSYDQ